MRPLSNLFLFLLVLGGGFYWGYRIPSPRILEGVHPDREYPVTEFRSFAFVVYGRNGDKWCDRTLRSLFAQSYDNYRVFFIDDASDDHTYEVASRTVIDCAQEHRTLLIRNETPLGSIASLYRAVDALLDREIVIPLRASDWLADTNLLNRLNRQFQNPDLWMVSGGALSYPAYSSHPGRPFISFYAALFKQLSLDLLLKVQMGFPKLLQELSGGRTLAFDEPLLFVNESIQEWRIPSSHLNPLTPLTAFPDPLPSRGGTDLVFLSEEAPLRIRSLLESIQTKVSGVHSITVLYRASDPQTKLAYETVAHSFEGIPFIPFERGRKLGRLIQKVADETTGETLLLAADTQVVADFIDLSACGELMEKTHVPAFLLQGKGKGIALWGNGMSVYAPGQPLSWALLRKRDISRQLKSIQSPSDLEAQKTQAEVCLGFDSLKITPQN